MAATFSSPEHAAITLGDYALLPGRRPFPSVAAVDLLATSCFPAVGVSLVAHATVTIHRPAHLVRTVVFIVGIDGAGPRIRIILPASAAVNCLAILEIIIPVRTVFAYASALSLAPRLRCCALRSFAPLCLSVPFLFFFAELLCIDAPPCLLIPDLIIVAETLRRRPILVFLALAGVSAPNTLIADRTALTGGAVIKLGETSAAVFEPR